MPPSNASGVNLETDLDSAVDIAKESRIRVLLPNFIIWDSHCKFRIVFS